MGAVLSMALKWRFEMTFQCPNCLGQVDSSSLRMEWSSGGAYYCPLCRELVRISLPYRPHVAVLSLLIAVGILMLLRVHGVALFLFLTVLIWVPHLTPPRLASNRRRSRGLSGVPIETAEGFVGYLGEYDTRTGWSNNWLLEGGTEILSGGVAVDRHLHVEPLVFLSLGKHGGL